MEVNFDTVKFSNDKCVEIMEALDFYADILLPQEIKSDILIDIETNSKLDVQGDVVSEEDDVDPRWFTITLRNKRGDDDIFKTLAHEMVHVKQYAMNEMYKCLAMKPCKTEIGLGTKWQGSIWEPEPRQDDYFDAPWEIEAFGREVGLYDRWLRYRYDS